MSSKRYTEEFKIAAVKQISERHYSVAEVSARLGVSQHSLYAWVKKYSLSEPVRTELARRLGLAQRLLDDRFWPTLGETILEIYYDRFTTPPGSRLI